MMLEQHFIPHVLMLIVLVMSTLKSTVSLPCTRVYSCTSTGMISCHAARDIRYWSTVLPRAVYQRQSAMTLLDHPSSPFKKEMAS